MSSKNAWTEKDERQYRHILLSERRRGRGVRRAREIAARTVNQRQRVEDRTVGTRRIVDFGAAEEFFRGPSGHLPGL